MTVIRYEKRIDLRFQSRREVKHKYVIIFLKNPNSISFDTYLLRGSSIWISNVLILDHGGRHHDLHPTQMLHSDHLDLFDAVGERRRRRQILEGFEYEPICRSDK